ncbi:bifunctional nuclease family protein [Candidatus Sumerlaeota bacterium]|nr:bifunctional nuclease family protein [Candidatus Sumerlaeota bacterium]
MLVEMELREILRGSDPGIPIVLVEKGGRHRQFPVVIGQYEAIVLENAVHHEVLERPLTHDLILNVVHGLGGKIRRVIVDKLVESTFNGTFHGKLDIEQADHSSVWIDSRPSDAIILATKLGIPIFVEEQVLHQVHAEPTEEDEDVE